MDKSIALTLAAGTLLLAGCCTSHHAVVWQYQTVGSTSEVNKLAADGWIVAGFTTYVEPGGIQQAPVTRDSFLLKRPKQ